MVEGGQRLGDGSRRGLALHGGGREHNLHQRVAPGEHIQDVPQGGPAGRGDHPHTFGPARQGPLALWIEQPLALQFLLEPHKLLEELALPGQPDPVCVELVLAAGLVDAEMAMHLHRLAIARQPGQPLRLGTPYDAAQIGAAVGQAEVQMAGGGLRQVGDLPCHPQILQPVVPLQQLAHMAIELAGSPDAVLQSEHGQLAHAAKHT